MGRRNQRKALLGDDRKMISYLLGDLSEEEEIEIEQRYFADDDYLDLLLAIEDELIDDYVRGALSEHERDQFEKYFLASPNRRQKVDIARAMMSFVSESALASAPTAGGLEPLSWRSLPSILRRTNRAFRLSLATVIVVVAVGLSWLIVDAVRLRNHLQQIQAERTVLQDREQQLEQQAAEERARGDRLDEELRRESDQRSLLEQEVERPSFQAVVSFVLAPGLLRDINKPRTLTLPPDARLVRLKLDLESDQHKVYRAVLRTVEEQEIWTRSGLKPESTRSGRGVVIRLPAGLLSKRDYILTLSGLTAEGTLEDVGEYYFRIVRK